MKARVLTLLAVGLALLAASCSGSDPIQPSVGTLAMRTSLSPAYDGRFALARIQVAQLSLIPSSGETGTPVGLALLPTRSTIDLRAGQTVTTPVRLAPGVYRVDYLQVGSVALNTEPVQPDFSACSGGVLQSMRELDSSTTQPKIPGELLGGGTAPRIVVQTGAEGTVSVTVDGAGLVAYLESRYNCGGNFLDDVSNEALAPFFSVN